MEGHKRVRAHHNSPALRLRDFGIATFFAACLSGTAADPPPLSQPEMQEILRTLQSSFASPGAAGFEALNRAAIDGLLREHPDLIQLLTTPDAASETPPAFLTATLTPDIACIRPASFGKEDCDSIRASLAGFAGGGSSALILDLRAPAPDSDPVVAAALAEMFLPKGTALFTFQSPVITSVEPLWTRELVVLIDRDTCNTGEILAAVLRANRRAFLIGNTTRGRTASVVELPLRKVEGGRLVLRYTAMKVSFAAGPDPFGTGISPDMSAALEPAAKRAVFIFQSREGLVRGVFEQARPRINEAALVARTNPEIPERIARTVDTAAEPGAPIDRPLQLAVDILTARKVLDPRAPK